jgi:hypothetical protein
VVFLEVQMPELSGFEVVERVGTAAMLHSGEQLRVSRTHAPLLLRPAR